MLFFTFFKSFFYNNSVKLSLKFLNYFNSTYLTNLNMNNLPTIIIYNDGIVENIYYNLNIEAVRDINLEGVK